MKTTLYQSMRLIVILMMVVGLSGSPAPSFHGTASKAQPILVQMAAREPDRVVSVIVQKAGIESDAEAQALDLGGKITVDLHIINGFAAELRAHDALELASSPGVTWVSLDAPVKSASDLPATFSSWASEAGAAASEPLVENFKNIPIAADRAIWFNVNVKPSGLGSSPATVRFFDGKIRFLANNLPYEIGIPEARILFSPTALSASVTFDPETNTWLTTVPSSYDHEAFLSGVALPLNVSLPGDIRGVTVTGRFTTDTPGVKVDWRWGAAVYTSFSTDYNALGIKPINGDKLNPYGNSDKAGSPENFKRDLVAGARGSGGTNYTGDWCSAKEAIYEFVDSNEMVSPLGPDGLFAHGSEVRQVFSGLDTEVTPGHAISKVEAILWAYTPARLSHDFKLKLSVGASTTDISLKHEWFDGNVGVANAGAVAVDITGARNWQWADFYNNLALALDQYPLDSKEIIYYDAIGLRVTSAPGLDTSLDSLFNPPVADSAVDGGGQVNVYNHVIGATQLWNTTQKLQGKDVTVAVVDSGIFKTDDLSGRIKVNVNFNRAYHNGIDRYGHGTLVAGIIAGSGKRSHGRYIGVAPKAYLLNVRIADDQGMMHESDVIESLQWVSDNRDKYNIRVVNLSLNAAVAQPYDTSPLDAACEILWFNGIVVVVSAGNNGTSTLFPPANDPFVITVGATDDKSTVSTADDTVATFSAAGLTENGYAKPDLVAPGRKIIGLLPDNDKLSIGQLHSTNRLDKTFFKMSGTSVSAPMVSGAVAILLQDEPDLTPDQVKYRLMATANKTWPGYEADKAGAGYLDVYAAVNATTTESANSGLIPSQLLWSASEPVVSGSVNWNSVDSTSVNWNSVNWNSVNWNSVNWNSVNWNSVNWNSVNWNSDYWEP